MIWKSIETLPVYYWYKIHDTDDLNYLFQSKPFWWRFIPKVIKKKRLEIIWDKISDEYIQRFGFNESFLKILRKQKEIARLQIKGGLKDDRGAITFIKIAELELEQLRSQNENNTDYLETIAWLEKSLGIRIDEMTCSVAKYKNYIKVVETMYKKQAA